MRSYRFVIYVGLFLVFFPSSFLFAGGISVDYKYAWSDTSGYVNFENVIVDDTMLSGFAWSENAGWINFRPARGGVFHDGSGNLSGYAWGENLGWIDFDGVTIDTLGGKFSGTATGVLVGTLTFDCPTYCDVRTDWRPPATVGLGLGGGGRAYIPKKQPSETVKCPSSNSDLAFEAFLQKTLSEKKRLGRATRLEMTLLALKIRNTPIFRGYVCQKVHTDTFGKEVPFFTCQIAEKARSANIISQTNPSFYPLQALSRIEAYATLMQTVHIPLPRNDNNWKSGVIKQAVALGFTVRTVETFEPERYLTIPEMYIITQRFYAYYKNHAKCLVQEN